MYRKYLIFVILFLLAACGPTTATQQQQQFDSVEDPGEVTQVPTGEPQYANLYEAWLAEGESALPQPLPSTIGPNGERIYIANDPHQISVRVFCSASATLCYAPGQHLTTDLADMSYFSGFVFANSEYPGDEFEGLDIWTFTNGYGLTLDEAISLSTEFPVTYTRQDGIQVPMYNFPYGGTTLEEAQSNWVESIQRRSQKLPELYGSTLAGLQSGLQQAQNIPDPDYRAFASSFWQRKIEQMQGLLDSSSIRLNTGLFQHYRTPTGWRGLIFVHLDQRFAYNGVDENFVVEGDRLGFYNPDIDDFVHYNYTSVGELPVLFHETGHGPCGSQEVCADNALATLTREFGARYPWDNSAFMLIIDNATGQSSAVNLP
ncbi:MAG: hypothetical protein WAU07_01080 [Microgenomates group bacterium]